MSAAKKSVVSVKETRTLMMSLRGFVGFRGYAYAHPIITNKLENHAGTAIKRSGRARCPVWTQ